MKDSQRKAMFSRKKYNYGDRFHDEIKRGFDPTEKGKSASQINVIHYHHETKKKADESRTHHQKTWGTVPSPSHLTPHAGHPNPKRPDGKYWTVAVSTKGRK